MLNSGLPHASVVVDENKQGGHFVDDNVEGQVDLVDEEVDTGAAQERLAGVLLGRQKI